MYVDIDAQQFGKILQYYLKLLMSYRQETVGGILFTGAPCRYLELMKSTET